MGKRNPGNALARADAAFAADDGGPIAPNGERVIDVRPMLEPDPDDPGALEEQLDEFDALANALAELDSNSGGAHIKIWRVDARDRKTREYVDECLPQNFTLRWLAEEHGGGTYNLMVYGPRADNPNLVKLITRKTLMIAGAPKLPKRDDTPNVPMIAGDNGAALVALANGIREGFQQLGSLIQTNAPKPKTTQEVLQEMLLLKQIIGGNAAPAANPLDMMKSVISLVKDTQELTALSNGGGDDGGGGGAMGVILGKLADKVLGGVGQLDAAPAEPVIAPLALTAEQIKQVGLSPEQCAMLGIETVPAPENVAHMPAPAAPVVPAKRAEIDITPQPSGAEGEQVFSRVIIKAALDDAVSNAIQNTDPVKYAGSIVADVPEALFELLEREDWLQVLSGQHPRVANFPVFFRAVRDELLRLDAEPEPDA